MTERLKWVQSLNSIGIEPDAILSMSDAEFQEKVALCQDCGLEPIDDIDLAKAIAESIGIDVNALDSKPAPKPKHSFPGRTDSGVLRDTQNEEFTRLQREEERRRREEEENRKKAEEKPEPKIKISRNKSKDDFKKALNNLGPEPATGVRIGFTFHDGKRVVRKFAPTTKGKALQTFIAGQDNMFDEGGKPLGFSLQQTIGPELDLNVSLKDQGINKSAMFSVVLDD